MQLSCHVYSWIIPNHIMTCYHLWFSTINFAAPSTPPAWPIGRPSWQETSSRQHLSASIFWSLKRLSFVFTSTFQLKSWKPSSSESINRNYFCSSQAYVISIFRWTFSAPKPHRGLNPPSNGTRKQFRDLRRLTARAGANSHTLTAKMCCFQLEFQYHELRYHHISGCGQKFQVRSKEIGLDQLWFFWWFENGWKNWSFDLLPFPGIFLISQNSFFFGAGSGKKPVGFLVIGSMRLKVW